MNEKQSRELFVQELTKLWACCGDRRPDELTYVAYYEVLSQYSYWYEALNIAKRMTWFGVPAAINLIEICKNLDRKYGPSLVIHEQLRKFNDTENQKLKNIGNLLKTGDFKKLRELAQ